MKKLLFIFLLYFESLVSAQAQIAVAAGGIPYCAEYETVYNAFTTKPDATRSEIYNTMVSALVTGGYWARMDIFRFYACHINTAGEALINWKIPGTFDATSFNAPTHTADQGFLFNGITQYVDNNWVPSVNGVNYQPNSASYILYIRTNIASNGYHGTGVNADVKNSYFNPRLITNFIGTKFNGNSQKTGANTDGSGLYVVTCVDATNLEVYRNKVQIIAPSFRDAKGSPTHSPYTGVYNDDNVAVGFRADQVAIEVWMNGCSQADVNAISDILNAAMTSLGTNVYSPTWLVFFILLIFYVGNKEKFAIKNEKDTININPYRRLAA